MKSDISKATQLGKASVFGVGAVVILAALFGTFSMAFAANGKQFILGKNNVARAISTLTKQGPGPALRLIVRPGQPPMAVNSSVRVKNLNADKVDGQDAAAFLASNGTAANADELDGLDSTAFGVTTKEAITPSVDCDIPDVVNECATIQVVVPAGKTYKASVWSSGSWQGPSGVNQGIIYCSAARQSSETTPSCITPGEKQNQTFVAEGTLGAGSSFGEATLTQGIWILSTRVVPGSSATTANSTANVITYVMVRDATAPGPPIE